MSQTDHPPRPKHYKPGSGDARYVRFGEDWLGYNRTFVLTQIAEAIEDHKQVLVLGANGIGKSFSIPALGLPALYTNPNTIVHVTAGTSTTLKNTIWKGAKGLFNEGKKHGLPGRRLDGSREIRSELGEEWYFECISPRYPDDLEGPHNEHVIYFIEEADKPGVSKEHIDSVRSTATDENDRVIVVANPPTDESNVVYDLIQSDSWHTLKFASWDSHNVRVERGIEDGGKIGGLVDTSKIQADWEEYHDESWPGLEQVIKWSDPDSEDFRTDLHSLWYKRRAGVVPPESSERWRPWSVADVEAAWNRDPGNIRATPQALGIDVARDVDETVVNGLHDNHAQIEYTSQDAHTTQRREIVDLIQEWPSPEINVDAIGKGQPLADELNERFPDVREFGNNQKAVDEKSYRYKWDEGLQLIGEWLRSGGTFEDEDLYEELKVAARVIQFEERALSSRGGKIIEATPKSELKEQLGRSPDRLDALLMGLHARDTEPVERNVPLAW